MSCDLIMILNYEHSMVIDWNCEEPKFESPLHRAYTNKYQPVLDVAVENNWKISLIFTIF